MGEIWRKEMRGQVFFQGYGTLLHQFITRRVFSTLSPLSEGTHGLIYIIGKKKMKNYSELFRRRNMVGHIKRLKK